MCDVRCAVCGAVLRVLIRSNVLIYRDSSPSLFSSSGTSAQIEAAKVVAETFLAAHRAVNFDIDVNTDKIPEPAIIGKAGATIKKLRKDAGVDIQVCVIKYFSLYS